MWRKVRWRADNLPWQPVVFPRDLNLAILCPDPMFSSLIAAHWTGAKAGAKANGAFKATRHGHHIYRGIPSAWPLASLLQNTSLLNCVSPFIQTNMNRSIWNRLSSGCCYLLMSTAVPGARSCLQVLTAPFPRRIMLPCCNFWPIVAWCPPFKTSLSRKLICITNQSSW